MSGIVENMNYQSHQYDQSFQTVPSSIPATPSPEQWSSELSPQSNGSSASSATASSMTPNGTPAHAASNPGGGNSLTAAAVAAAVNGHHHPHLAHHSHPHHAHTYPGIHSNRDANPLSHTPFSSQLSAQNVMSNISNISEGKPVIQAASLAGKCTQFSRLRSISSKLVGEPPNSVNNSALRTWRASRSLRETGDTSEPSP